MTFSFSVVIIFIPRLSGFWFVLFIGECIGIGNNIKYWVGNVNYKMVISLQ
ncbi:hypothetical protein K040078D81_42240 [Blautia hominis]|uniref:Uncharacterized protein n=1 Tax=Blautia hominis TaxID=2025493 RepID=A0ABQ0BF82_9FIRM